MNRSLIPARPFSDGYNEIVRRGGSPDMLMDFGIIRLKTGQVYQNNEPIERVLLLVQGTVTRSTLSLSLKGQNSPNRDPTRCERPTRAPGSLGAFTH